MRLLVLAASLAPAHGALCARFAGPAARGRAAVCMQEAAEATAEKPALSEPPPSFKALIQQAVDATAAAIDDGSRLMEIEFPPVPLSKLEDSSISAYELLDANLQLTTEFSKRLLAKKYGGGTEGTVAITLPDTAERARSADIIGSTEPAQGVRLWGLSGGEAEASPFAAFSALFKTNAAVEAAPWASVYILLGFSCVELPAIRTLAELSPEVPIICFNLKLDTLRGDLGLPGFPGKEVHHTFLSKVKPVYYMRPRSYSLSLSAPPFLLAYSGVLFRCYPEGFQTLLDNGRGKYRQVLVEETRPALGKFKAELTRALKLSDDAAASAISQTGYKQSTWWEDNAQGLDISAEWRA